MYVYRELYGYGGFQSTLPRGSDVTWMGIVIKVVLFQSTLPRGSDFMRYFKISGCFNFNPRSLAGATNACYSLIASTKNISIHAPSRERQHGWQVLLVKAQHFNPRSLAGATTDGLNIMHPLSISIHAPSRERQLLLCQPPGRYAISIHAPSRERL